jgi:hypothetical protein
MFAILLTLTLTFMPNDFFGGVVLTICVAAANQRKAKKELEEGGKDAVEKEIEKQKKDKEEAEKKKKEESRAKVVLLSHLSFNSKYQCMISLAVP